MGRKAIYSSAAERTRAYRARLEQQAAELGTTAAPAPPAKPPKKKAAPKPLSRPKRLEAVLDEVNALLGVSRHGLRDRVWQTPGCVRRRAEFYCKLREIFPEAIQSHHARNAHAKR